MIAKKQQLPTVALRAPSTFVYDKRKDDWELLENIELVGDPTLELVEFLKDKESFVPGDVMRERAKELGGLTGQFHAERLLGGAESIPKEWRQFYLLFPGTVWRDSGGDLLVPYLRWDGDRWFLGWGWLDGVFYSSFRVLRLCK